MGRGYTADTSESPLGRDGGTVPCQVSDIGGASQKLGGPHAEHHSPLFKVKTLKDYLNALQQKSICGCKKCVHKIVFWPSGDCIWDHHISKRERKTFLDTVYRGLNNQNCTRVEEADTCKREDEIRMQNPPKCGDDRRGASERAAGADQVEEEKLKLARGENGDATQETRQEKGPNDSEVVKLNNADLEENKIADAAEDGERSVEDEDAVRWKEDPKEKGMKDLRPEKTVKESGDAEFHTGMQESADKEGENEAEEAGDGVPDENDVGQREASLKARAPGSGKAGHLDFESVGAEPEDYNRVIEEEPETDAADGEVSQLDSNPAAGRQGGENEAADLNESSLREACDVQSQSFKPRRVTGEKGEVETSAPPNQNIGGQGKAAETGQVVNYTGCALRMTGGNGDKDDDDDKKKPRPSDPLKTRLDCDRPARKKGQKGKKESRSPSAEEVKWEATGAKPKKVPRGPKIVSGPELLRQQELEKKMRGLDLCSRRDEHKEGPAGDAGRARHQALTAHLSLTSSPGRSALPHNSHNQQAVRRLYLDNGAQAKHGVVLKGILCGPPRAARPASRMEVGQGAEASPLAEAPVPRGTAAGDGPPPAGVPPEVEIPPGVSHGEPRSLIVLAERFGQLKLTDAAELQGQHEGVLLDRELKPMNHQYLEGDQYIKLLFLGRGSFGDVYLVQDTASDKKVVVKRVPVRSFAITEATLWCGLDHPGIVPLLGLLRTDDMVLFISAYYPESSTLQQLINQSVLGQGRSLLITQQVLWAVLYLHSQGIIHKDIKPDNILMLPGDRALLIDFGLATQQTETFQADEALKGTECYMAPEIAGGQKHDGRVDVWSAICTLLCMISGHPPWSQRFKGVRLKIYIIAMSQAPLEDIPPNAHPRMRRFLQQTLVKDFLERPTAAQALELLPLDIVEETFNCLAVAVETEAESEPMEVSAAIPDDVLAGPLTPWTPRGPEDGLPQFPPSPAARPDSRLVENEMSLSHLFISPEDREEQRGVDASGADEDMYGPPSDVDGPEIFNDGAIQDRSLGSRSGTSSVGGRKLPRQPSCNAANFDLPWPIRGDFGGASQAAASFMQDEPANPSGTSAASASFELQPMSLSGSSRDFHSISTAHARIAEAGWLPSLEGIPRDEPDIGGAGAAAAIDTSGVDTNSPRHSAEDMASVTDTAESVSSAISFGSVINIYAEGARLMRMKVDLDFTARQLVKEIVRQPDYLQSKLKEKEFTLCWQASQGAIDLHHTFGRGEHHVVAVATSAVGVWLWRSNCNGQITLATQAE